MIIKKDKKMISWFEKMATIIVRTIQNGVDYFLKANIEERTKLFLGILIIFVLIFVFKLPFVLIENIGIMLLDMMIYPLQSGLKALLGILMNISYFCFSIFVFFKLFKKMFLEKGQILEAKKFKNKKNLNVKTINTLSKIFMIFYQMLIVFIYILSLIFVVGLILASILIVTYIIRGVYYFGILIVIISLLSFFAILLHLLEGILRVENNYNNRTFGAIVATIILFAFGLCLTTVELVNTKYIQDIPEKDFSLRKESYNIVLRNKTKLFCEKCGYDYKIKYDDSLDGNAIIKVSYYEDYTDTNFIQIGNTIRIIEKNAKMKNMVSLIIDNLKEEKIYDYEKLYKPMLEIVVNSKDANLLSVIIDKSTNFS